MTPLSLSAATMKIAAAASVAATAADAAAAHPVAVAVDTVAAVAALVAVAAAAATAAAAVALAYTAVRLPEIPVLALWCTSSISLRACAAFASRTASHATKLSSSLAVRQARATWRLACLRE